MSTIKAANVQNTGSGAPTFKNSSGTEIGQLAKAWVNFNGTGTVAIRDSFNVSSITDDGSVGSYSINFTNAFADTNYVAIGFSGFGTYARTSTPATTSAYKVGTFDTRTAANEDQTYVYMAFFAD